MSKPDKDDPLFWLQNLTIIGREDDDEGDEDQDDEGDDGDDDGEEDEDQGKKGGSNSDKDEDDSLEAKVAELEKALTSERKLRRKAERDAKRSARRKQTEADKADEDDTKKQLEAAQATTKRLASRLLNKSIDEAILEEARRQGFIDPSDALTDAVRRDVDADQDDDDPSDVDVDLDSVKDAVQDLANKKKHLVGKGTPNEPSGGKFRKGKRGDSDNPDERVFKERYPSLN